MPQLVVGGARIALESAPTPVLDLFARRFPRFFSPGEGPPANAALRFSGPAEEAKLRSIRRDFGWERARPFYGQRTDGRLTLTDGASIAAVDWAQSSADFHLAAETLADAVFFERSFLLVPLLEILKNFGLHYVHGSFVARGERGVLFLGRGGSGKTTFSAELARQGWSWISDDNLLLAIEAGRPVLRAFEQDFSLHPDLASRLGVAGRLAGGKVRVAHGDWPFSAAGHQSTPTVIVDLEGDSPTPTDADKASLLDRLIRENPTLWLGHRAGEALAAYRDLLRPTRTMALRAHWSEIPALTYSWTDV